MKGIRFIFENCETMFIPTENIMDIDLVDMRDDEFTMYLHIKGIDNIRYRCCYDSSLSPIQRITQSNDIVEIEVIQDWGEVDTYRMIWNEDNQQDNYYQYTELISWDEIIIDVSVDKDRTRLAIEHKPMIRTMLSDFEELDSCSECYNNELCSNNHKLCDILREIIRGE